MTVNKVVYGANTLIDISDTTATADKVAKGLVFYLADGTRTVGTYEATSSTPTEHSIALHPSGYTAGTFTWSNPSNAYDEEGSTTAATLTASKKANTQFKGYLTFDMSGIPATATSISVSITARMSVKASFGKGSSGSWTQCGITVCNGTTTMGDEVSLSANSTATTLTASSSGWTGSTLQNLTLMIDYYTNSYGAEDNAAVITFYGATATVSYTA